MTTSSIHLFADNASVVMVGRELQHSPAHNCKTRNRYDARVLQDQKFASSRADIGTDVSAFQKFLPRDCIYEIFRRPSAVHEFQVRSFPPTPHDTHSNRERSVSYKCNSENIEIAFGYATARSVDSSARAQSVRALVSSPDERKGCGFPQTICAHNNQNGPIEIPHAHASANRIIPTTISKNFLITPRHSHSRHNSPPCSSRDAQLREPAEYAPAPAFHHNAIRGAIAS